MRLIQNDKLSSYEEPLEKDGSVSVHHRNIQSLATDVCDLFKMTNCHLMKNS